MTYVHEVIGSWGRPVHEVNGGTRRAGMPLLGVRLPARPEAVETARHQVRELLALHRADPSAIDNVELLTSELVTNGVVHVGGASPGTELDLALIREGDRAVVEVRDPSGEFSYENGMPDELGESGWGLFMVSTIADDHGVDLSEDSGKTVWFTIEAWVQAR